MAGYGEKDYDQAKGKFKKGQIENFLNVKSAQGDIISWMYEPKLKIFVIQRDNGVQYFEKLNDILKLPHWDVRTLVFQPFINCVEVELLRYMVS